MFAEHLLKKHRLAKAISRLKAGPTEAVSSLGNDEFVFSVGQVSFVF